MLAALLLCVVAAAAVPWPAPAVSWWYAPDNNWPKLIQQVHAVVIVPAVLLFDTFAYAHDTVH